MITTTTRYSFLLILATVLLCFPADSDAFQLPTTNSRQLAVHSKNGASVSTPQVVTRAQKATATSSTTTQLHNLFGNLFGQQESSNQASDNNPVVDVIEIPTKLVKIKPLKFFLQIFFVGIQNTPFKGAWLLNANEEVEDYLEVYFNDGTGMLRVEFDVGFGLKITRKGTRPSLQYMLQESVLLHAVLDELEAIAFGEGDGDVKDEERLLQFTEENQDILERERAKLPARAAPKEE